MRRPRTTDATVLDPTQWLLFLGAVGAAALLSLVTDLPFRYFLPLVVAEIIVFGVIIPLLRMKKRRREEASARKERFEAYRSEMEGRRTDRDR